MLGGDEIGALVVDVGAQSTRGGYSGDDCPKAIFPSQVGVSAGASDGGVVGNRNGAVGDEGDVEMKDGEAEKAKGDGRKFHVGVQALSYRRDGMDVVGAVHQGQVQHWDAFEQLLTHTFSSLRVDPHEHPLLLSEPPHVAKPQRLRLCELVFEKYNPPALFVAKSPVLAAFAAGRTNATVVDCGASQVVVSAVHEGFSLTKSVKCSELGGDALDRLVQHQLAQLGHTVVPRFAVKRQVVNEKIEVSRLDFPNTSPSYREYCVKEVVRELKEGCCAVQAFADALPTPPPECYELPQGSVADFESRRFRAGELLFNPAVATSEERRAMRIAPDIHLQGLSNLVFECVSASDVDLRRDLFNNVVVVGGASLLQGVHQQLQSDVVAQAPQGYKTRVTAGSSSERRFGTWIGGSILASLGSFHQIWISKAEYEENGAKIIEKRCP